MLLYKIYSSPISVGIFQILTFSIIWMVICKYFRNNDKNINFADIKSDREFIIQSIITLIICLIPINAIYSITLWKDVLFSYAILFLCFLIKVLVDRKCKVSIKFIVLMGFVMACVAQLRLNGIYVIVPLLIIMAYYLYRHDKTEKFFIKLPVIAIIFILLIASLNVVYNVEDNAKDATLSKTTHMLANYDLYHKLDAKDSAKFHELINETAVKDNYKTFFTDPVRNAANESVFEANKGEYIGMAVKYSLQDPIHFIKYMLSSSEITWDITRDSYWQGKPYYINEDGANLESSRNNYFKAYHTKPVADYENVTGVNEGSGLYNMLNSFVYTARTNVVLDTLFESPALYMFLSILAMAGIYYMTKSKDIILVYLPNLFNILVVFVSIPTQDNRYLYPNLLVFYLLVIIIVRILTKQKLSSTPKTAAASNELPSPQEDSDAKIDAIIDNLSPEEIQSILNEPEEVSPTQNAEDVEYDELDAIIDNLTPEEVSSILNEPEEETSPKAETVEKEDVKKQEKPKETQPQEKPKQEAQKEQTPQQQTIPKQQTKKQTKKQEIPPMKTVPKQQRKTTPNEQTQKQVVFQKEIQKQQKRTTQKQQPQQIQKQQPQQRKVNEKQFSKRKETKEQMEARIRAKVLKDLEREKQNKK
ncbi:hypothetical protein [Methanobrevibacter sp.]|uniref:hypothetical protein n=1 Tax=Methanobrevibacter sp. TaxID=66852 RepID=UPI0038665C9F